MFDFGLVPLFIILAVIVAIVKGVRIVPQGEEWVVERLGKFAGVLSPGQIGRASCRERVWR